jgi:small subunit ribosomal protein S11
LAKQDKAVKKGGTRTKKRITRTVPSGIAHVKATFNNTIVSITDPSGNVISWASAGKTNFTGSRKSSAFAASVAAQDAGKIAMNHGMKEVEVCLKGPGSGRESAVRGLQSAGLIITMIKDKTPIPHNGCRPRKRRRV